MRVFPSFLVKGLQSEGSSSTSSSQTCSSTAVPHLPHHWREDSCQQDRGAHEIWCVSGIRDGVEYLEVHIIFVGISQSVMYLEIGNCGRGFTVLYGVD